MALLLPPGAHLCPAAEERQGESADPFSSVPQELRANLVDATEAALEPPFSAAGEQLSFKLGWGMFTVASATLTNQLIAHAPSGEPAWNVTLLTRTNSFADAFYKVRNFSWTWFKQDVSAAIEYGAQQNEGKHLRDVIIRFDTDAMTALRHNRLEDIHEEPVTIVPGTFDPLSIVFLVRSLDLAVGREFVIPTSNGRELFFTIVRVTAKVTRRFSSGRHTAYVVEPDIKDLGGVFKRSRDGNVRFFFSADERKLPLRMESEVAVGSFWAELTTIPPAPATQK
jgi:hypothetical protein